MRYHERDDRELLELAQAGWAPAFAVLVHRHGPALLTAFAEDPDPADRVTDVFVRAMRQLPERDPAEPVGPWLFALAGRPAPETVPDTAPDTMDPIWHRLTPLWPDGRRARRPHPVARKVVTVVGAIALGVAVPTIVLGIPAPSSDQNAAKVRAEPLEDEPVVETRSEELPTFEFPDVGGGDGTQAPADAPTDPVTTPETAPSPTAPVVPAPAPAPTTTEPPPPTVDEPVSEPTTEPTAEPTAEPEPTAPPPPPPSTDGDGDGGGAADDGTGGGDDGDVLGITGADRP